MLICSRSDYSQDKMDIEDLDEASKILHEFVASRTSSGASRERERLPVDITGVDMSLVPELVGLNTNVMSLASVYDHMVSKWLSPLNPHVPGNVRLAKEQLARKVATDLYCSTLLLRKSAPEREGEKATSQTSQSNTGDAGGSSPGDLGATTQPASTDQAADATASSSTTDLKSVMSRLAHYTTIATDKLDLAEASSASSAILAHWELGADPNTYDWLATKERLETDADEEDLSMEERAKIKRRAARRLERQRRETANARAESMASSQAPQLISASQPVASTRSAKTIGGRSQPLVLLGSSQGFSTTGQEQGQDTILPASQIEPGRFGGRIPPKKKRRTQGF